MVFAARRRARTWGLVLWAGVALLGAGCRRARADDFRLRSTVPEGSEAFEAALFQTTGRQLVPAREVELIDDGTIFDALEREIRKARRSVHVVVFIWRAGVASDRVIRALKDRTAAGVTCRVLVDPLGSPGFGRAVAPALEGAGCRWAVFRPLPADENLARNHRKIVVVDGEVGITGGFGIHQVWEGNGDSPEEWRDINARVEGPVVSQMQQAFAENWQETTGELLPREDFPFLEATGPSGAASVQAAFVSSTANPEVTRAERLTQLLVMTARERLWIQQAYFTPNRALRILLAERARAGVDVRIIAAGDRNDHPEITLLQRTSYDDLVPAGIRIWEYQPSMMHAKTMLVDDDLALIGSINYDPLSFNFLEEGALLVRDRRTAQKLSRLFEEDVGRARPVRR